MNIHIRYFKNKEAISCRDGEKIEEKNEKNVYARIALVHAFNT